MKIFINYILVFLALPLLAQKDTTKLQINQVEVVKSFEANLEEARKVTLKSVLPVQKEYHPSYQYDITIVPIELKSPEPQVKPLAMNPDGPFIVKKGYLFAGYGLRKNPEVMAGYHFAKKDTYDAGIHLKYQSLDNSTDVPYQKYRNAGVDLYGSYLIKENMKLYGNVTTDFRKRYFYHTDLGVDTYYNDVQSERDINRYAIKAGISNPEPTRFNINYDLNLSLRNMKITNGDARENGVALTTKIEKHFKKSTVFGFDAGYDYTAFNGSKELSLSTATLTPVLKTKISNLIIQAGVNLLYSSDGQSSIFPDIMLGYGIAGPNLQVFAGVQQTYYTNNFHNVTYRNAYLSTQLDSLQNTIYKSFYGGIKGQFSFLNYQVKGGWKQVNQQMFLLNNRTDLRQFDMTYGDIGIAFITGNLDFVFAENITFGGWLTQNIFSLDSGQAAWHTPNLEANAYAAYKLWDGDLTFRGDLYFGNNVSYLDKSDTEANSNVLFDLNLTAEYAIGNAFRIYVKGINLLDNKFERWYGYPSVGINGMVGIKVVF